MFCLGLSFLAIFFLGLGVFKRICRISFIESDIEAVSRTSIMMSMQVQNNSFKEGMFKKKKEEPN